MAAPHPGKIHVLDTWPVMAWIQQREPVTSAFDPLIEQAMRHRIQLLMSRINFGEVLDSCWKLDRADSAQFFADVEALPIDLVSVDDLLENEAAKLNARTTASCADCFVAALALPHRAPVVTGDQDFRDLLRVQPAVQLYWLGA